MGDKSEKTLWDIAIQERNRTEQENRELSDGSYVGSEGTNVFFLGSKNSGKSSLIMRFLDRDENPKPTVALEYLFGRRSRGANTIKDVTHIWELGGGTFLTKLIDTVITPRTIRSMSVVVVIDLSKPNELWATSETLLNQLKIRINQVVNEASGKDPSIQDYLKQQLSKRINEEHPDKSMMEPFLVPLVIVGSKYDLYQDFDPEKRKIISKTLRFLAHTYGATLQFFSTKNESLVARARQLIGNLAFHFPPSKTNVTDYNKPILVPAGTDLFSQIGAPPLSDEQLGKISARRPMDLWKSAFCQYFPQDTTTNSNISKNPAVDPQYLESIIDNMRIQKDKMPTFYASAFMTILYDRRNRAFYDFLHCRKVVEGYATDFRILPQIKLKTAEEISRSYERELEQYRRQSERKAKERKMARENENMTSTRGGGR